MKDENRKLLYIILTAGALALAWIAAPPGARAEEPTSFHESSISVHPVDQVGEELQTIAKTCRGRKDFSCVNAVTMLVTTRVAIKLNCAMMAPMIQPETSTGRQLMGECLHGIRSLDQYAGEVFGIKTHGLVVLPMNPPLPRPRPK